MGTTPIKLLLIVLFAIPLQCYCHVSSVVEEEQDVMVEDQLKILNKTPIKTIRTEVGDVFDCIDINKQPSLDHPFLKNHVIKTRPISHSINTIVDDDHEVVSSSSPSPSSVKPLNMIAILRKLDCPDGTIPIRRTSKEDLRRVKSFSKSQLRHSTINDVGDQLDDLENPAHGEFLSIAKTRKDPNINYLGIRALMNVYNPSAIQDQVSAAQLWIENSLEGEFYSLQAGWIVAPSLFGDNETHFFVKWQVHGSNKSEGCYNILCPGFVQVDRARPVGATMRVTSKFGSGMQYEMQVSINEDGGANWWLDINGIKIGYWPAELGFSQLTRGSSVFAWGGLASGLGVTTTFPPMGNGHFPNPERDFTRQCYMRQMKVISPKTGYWEDPTRKNIDTFTTNKKCSDIAYYGQMQRYDSGHTLAFGGPGGNC